MLRIFGIALFGIALFATDADADRYDDCQNEDDMAVVIRGCTEIIQRDRTTKARIFAYTNRGNAYSIQGRHDEAVADLTKAVELAPKDPNRFYNRGDAYRDKGDNERAIADYTSAIKLRSDFRYFTNRGLVYAKQEKLDLALADFSQTIRMSPTSAGAYMRRAEIQSRRGDLDAAIRDQTKAVELTKERLWKRLAEADLRLFQSREADAIAILREVLADKGTDETDTSAKEEAKEKLEKLTAASGGAANEQEPGKQEPSKQELSKQEPSSKQGSNEPDRIEVGRVYNLELAAEPAHFETLFFQGLEQAGGMRATISVVSLGSHPTYLPKLTVAVASTPEDIQGKSTIYTRWVLALRGKSPMSVEAMKFQGDRRADKGQDHHHRVFNRKLRADQSINIDVSWATAGKIVFTIDGSEKHEIPLSESVKYLLLAPSTGTFKLDDMIFRKGR
ncbi:tetratricopeptide repeat protein [Pseudorhodoplanes sp.]|uniref:tetratricopeptide repeat protein n=1 Tax=Pseudorhodoplanes sp. TaxID=1934341 RepID=UPI003D111AB0